MRFKFVRSFSVVGIGAGLVLAVWLCLAALTAQAAAPAQPDILLFAHITVNTTADEYNTGASCSLREAVKAANSNADFGGCTRNLLTGAETILLPAGTYQLTRNGFSEDANVTGDLDITSTVLISSTGGSVPTVRGESAWDDRVLEVIAGSVTINRINIGFGNAVNGRYGGGILVDVAGNLTLNNLTVGNNIADGGGGGILNIGILKLVNSNVNDNIANGVDGGGGIYNAIGATLTLITSTVSNNQAPNGQFGGGIYNDSNARLTLLNTTVSGNDLPEGVQGGGGGIFSYGPFTITRSTISGNTTEGDSNSGAGIFCANAVAVIDSSLISGNTASPNPNLSIDFVSGGGINSNCRLTIKNSVIRNNVVATRGGGGGIVGSNIEIIASTISGNQAHGGASHAGEGSGIYSFGGITITNSTISGNQSDGEGGGVNVYGGSLLLVNVTVANNTSNHDLTNGGTGGGVYVKSGASVTMRNSVLAGNTEGGGGSYDDCDGTITSGGYILVQNANGCTVTGAGGQFNVDAKLNALANNGGLLAGAGAGETVKTHSMQSSSPLIDNGDPTGCKDRFNVALTIDQRGFPRPIDGPDPDGIATCDVGAFEYGSSPPDISLALVGPTTIISPANTINSILYTVTVQNVGNLTVTSVIITDVLTGGLLWDSASLSCVNVSGNTTIRCVLGTLGPGATTLVQMRYHVQTPSPACNATFTNSANATAIGETNTTNNNDALNTSFVCSAPLSAVDLGGPGNGFVGTTYVFTAAVVPLNAILPITYVWRATNQLPVTHTDSGLGDLITFTWNISATQRITLTANNQSGTVSSTHSIAIVDSYQIYLPLALKNF